MIDFLDHGDLLLLAIVEERSGARNGRTAEPLHDVHRHYPPIEPDIDTPDALGYPYRTALLWARECQVSRS